jgi:hypothetical protein
VAEAGIEVKINIFDDGLIVGHGFEDIEVTEMAKT